MSTWIGLLALIIYAATLGGVCVMVWRYYRGFGRCLPALATAVYYVLLVIAPAPVGQAMRDGIPYPWGDAARNSASALALLSGLVLLHRVLKERK